MRTSTIRDPISSLKIWDDQWGIPHARAATSSDAFYAQGWCQARDRLWQLAADRQKGIGAWSSWVGKQGLTVDQLHRRLDLASASRADFEAFDEATRSAIISFADGVNAGAAALGSVFELQLLGVEFDRWEPWHSVLVYKARHVGMGGYLSKIWRSMVLRLAGPDALATLRYDDGAASAPTLPANTIDQEHDLDLSDLTAGIVALEALPEPGGSNAWALGGERTASGLPLVAGDPHRAFEQPNVYYQQHIACDSFDAIGFAIPGVPGFTHFGHNDRVAWCITHAFIDDQDVFVEKIVGGRYLDAGEWRPLQVESNQIEVRGGDPVELRIERTCRGPLILGGTKLGVGLSLAWTSLLRPNRGLTAMLPMLKSRSVADLHKAVQPWVEPGNTLVSADVDGHIGCRIRGAVPRRPASNSWLPAPGWAEASQWKGVVPPEDLPSVIDPDCAFIVTANNRPIMRDHETRIGVQFQPPDRADRIQERIESLDFATVDDMIGILNDLSSRPAKQFAAAALSSSTITGDDEDTKFSIARLLFDGWNGTMSSDSAAAALYAVFRNELTMAFLSASGLRAIRNDWIRDEISIGLTADLWWIVPRLLRTRDTTLLGEQTWNDLILISLERATNWLKDRLGSDPLNWKWGDLHRSWIAHPLSRHFPDEREMLDPPSTAMDGDGDTIFATGFSGRIGFGAVYGSVARYVFDLSDWGNCRWIVPMGSSNDPASDHRHDQFGSWSRGELIPMLYGWDRIRAEAKEMTKIELTPYPMGVPQ